MIKALFFDLDGTLLNSNKDISSIGIIPNANGANKPDILLWKDIRKK